MAGIVGSSIGDSIARAGAAIGGYYTNIADLGFKRLNDEEKEARAMQRAEALERLKDQLLEERAQKDAAKAVEVEARATEIGEKRAAKQLTADANKLASNATTIAGDSPAMTADEMKAHLESLTPAERKALDGAGLITRSMSRNEARLQAVEDQVQAARELGASSSLLKSYQDTKKSVLEEIKEENRDRRAAEAEDRRSREFQALLPIRQQTADAATTRANRPAGGSGGGEGAAKVRSTYTDGDGNRVAVMSDGSTKVLGTSGDFNKSVANLIKDKEKNDFNFKNKTDEEKKTWATNMLASGGRPKSSDNSASRPPLDSFKR